MDTSLSYENSVWQRTCHFEWVKRAKNPRLKGVILHFKFVDTSLRSVWQQGKSVQKGKMDTSAKASVWQGKSA